MATRQGNRTGRVIDPAVDAPVVESVALDGGTYRVEFTASASLDTEIAFALVRAGAPRDLVPAFVGVGLAQWTFTGPVQEGDKFAVVNKSTGLRIVVGSVTWQCVGVLGGL